MIRNGEQGFLRVNGLYATTQGMGLSLFIPKLSPNYFNAQLASMLKVMRYQCHVIFEKFEIWFDTVGFSCMENNVSTRLEFSDSEIDWVKFAVPFTSICLMLGYPALSATL